jgi:hypothetical protein
MNILLLAQNKFDTTSFYRANGVFGNLSKQLKGNISITSMDHKNMSLSWADLMLYDVVVMQRPYDDSFKRLAVYIKDLNIPLWIDYDDNLLAVPPDNKQYVLYSDPAIIANVTGFLAMADVVTVSTHGLKKAFDKYNPRIEVVPNAFNQDLFNYRDIKKRNDTVLWRGSETHQLDLMTHTVQLVERIAELSNWKWHFCGWYPWMLASPNVKNLYHSPVADVVPYHKNIHNVAPKAMIVPLANHLFNHCKSNIAALEGIFAGAVCIVPNWEEWQIPGTLKYDNPAEFSQHIQDIYHGRVKIKENNDTAWEYINDVYPLNKINKKRIEILNSLV